MSRSSSPGGRELQPARSDLAAVLRRVAAAIHAYDDDVTATVDSASEIPVEREDADKPVCVAEMLMRLLR